MKYNTCQVKRKEGNKIIDRFKEYIYVFQFVTPGIIVVFTFIIKIILMTEYKKSYEIPIKYFSEIDMRNFLIYSLIFVEIVFLFMRNSNWEAFSYSDSSSKFTSRMFIVWYATLLICIFSGETI